MVYTTKVFFSILYFLTKAFVVYTTAERHSEEQGAARSRRKREEREKGGEGQRKEKKGGEKGERARTDRGGRKRKGTYSKKGETRGRQGKEGEEGQGGEDCQTADMTNTGRISPSFTNEVGCERAAALLKVFNALRRC